MKKYLTLTKISWENGLTYRLNFLMWRVRQVLSLLTAYFLWHAVFSTGHQQLFGYTESRMLTYIFVAGFLQAVVLASRAIDLAAVINSGDLSNILIRPISNFWYWISQDIADKSLNILFSLGELLLLFLFLRPSIIFPALSGLILFVPVVLFSTFLYFLVNYLFGLLGFWTPDVWAPRFLLLVVLQFIAGSLFPLDVLPQAVQSMLSWTPFPYLIFFPTQVFLGQINVEVVLRGVGITLLWIGIFWLIVKFAWRKGLHLYSSEGR